MPEPPRASAPSTQRTTIVHEHKAKSSFFRAGLGTGLGCLAAVMLGIGGCVVVTGMLASSVSKDVDEARKQARQQVQSVPDGGSAIEPNLPPPSVQPEFEIVDISTKITEQNEVWSRFAWIMKVRWDGDEPRHFNAEIEWLDSDGFVVDRDTAYHLTANPGEVTTFRGDTLIMADSVSKVDSISAKTR